MRSALSLLLGIGLFSILGVAFLLHSQNASAAATHLVISEVQIAGASSTNDFIEIYNPTSLSVSLDGYRLGKRTSGTTSASLVAFSASASVPAHGYFLWCNSSLSGSINCDASNSGTVANDNSIALINGDLATGTIVDAVTFGTPGSTFGEGTSLVAPSASSSVERKANSLSTSLTMGIGGLDEFAGNGEDTDNNASDFVTRDIPQPQNSSSAVEPIENSPTPTIQPSNSPTPTLTLTPTPTLEPSVTPTPTESPTPSPTEMPSPTPSENPSVTPTTEPSPTPSVTPTVMPSETPMPTPTPGGGKVIVHTPTLICTLNYRPWRFFNKIFYIPFVICTHR